MHNPDHGRLPPAAREALLELVGQVEALRQRIEHPDTAMVRRTRTYEAARRLATIPGVGAITASALQAFVPDPNGFGSGWHFAAWLGLTRRPHLSGGKERLRYAKKTPEATDWSARLLARRPFKVAAVAIANRIARVTRALLFKGGTYTMPAAA